MVGQSAKVDNEWGEWGLIDSHVLFQGKEDPPMSFHWINTNQDHNEENLGGDARNSLERLRVLLSSSTPEGTRPGMLEPPQQETNSNQKSPDDSVNIGHEINSLLNFVDNFEFESPVPMLKQNQHQEKEADLPHLSLKKKNFPGFPTQHSVGTKIAPKLRTRNPLGDRTNESLKEQSTISSNLQGEVLWPEELNIKPNPDVAAVTQEPEGRLLSSDRSDIEISPHQQQQQELQEGDWERFNQLLCKLEDALQEANQERYNIHAWSKQVHKATIQWVEGQQALLEQDGAKLLYERKCITLSGHKEKDFYEAKIEKLENAIQGLQLDLRTIELHHQTNEKRLHNMIIFYQQENLHKKEEVKQFSSGGIPWAKQNEYVDSLEAHTRELKNRSTPLHQESHCDLYSKIICWEGKENNDNDPWMSAMADAEVQKNMYSSSDVTTKEEITRNGSIPSSTHDSVLRCFLGTVTPESHGWQIVPEEGLSSGIRQNGCGAACNHVIAFRNGACKEVRSDGSSVVKFPNGDVEIFAEAGRSVAYFYAKSQVIQVAMSDRSEIFKFPNQQVERHYPDGCKIVKFPNGRKKRIFPSGMVETFTSHGKYTVIRHPNRMRDVKHL